MNAASFYRAEMRRQALLWRIAKLSDYHLYLAFLYRELLYDTSNVDESRKKALRLFAEWRKSNNLLDTGEIQIVQSIVK